MSIYIADLLGVLFSVEYTLVLDSTGLQIIEYQSVRILEGAAYTPCGPDLLVFMHALTAIRSRLGPLAIAEPVLSIIGDEICNSLQKNSPSMPTPTPPSKPSA